MRDATHAELRDEPDGVLQALVDGTMTGTWTTRELAKNELAAQRGRRDRPSRRPA